ncbi:class III aminotransferase [Thioclava sp. L04-15]|uniref:3-keto-5-aminohexanoate cleavage protein n=1 Tax=Thioclava sp. L04-15 TaxID=1915318 RepID=UPI000997F80A|nr:3-keto-5-aminohexanoate cleavage protein [Thioclava sp. L04-15]OOY28775.1 class III aminotransferase [Thioclava sp. L04-15]TNE94472.1 MAG: 3-keto-5-aminohexanoate cleavage protein [Paracoccaceae bacterium]
MSLPRIMVAPNGATKTKADHPALPISLDEITETALACQAAGAGALHLHLRDDAEGHLLDTGAYREALAHLRPRLGDMAVQITTEASGRYEPGHQRYVALNSGAEMVSVSTREMLRDPEPLATKFFEEAAERGVRVQHILYSREDAEALARVLPDRLLQDPGLQLIFVMGRYVEGQVSTPAMLDPFLSWMQAEAITPDWAICAFGQGETACLRNALEKGGKARVGFENSLVMEDGSTARDNAARVVAIAAL